MSVIRHWQNATIANVSGYLVREDGERIAASVFIRQAIQEAQAAPTTTSGAMTTLTNVRVWAEIVRDRSSNIHVRRHMLRLLGMLDNPVE